MREDIIDDILFLVKNRMLDAGYGEKEFAVVDACLYGSRISGKFDDASDLDVLIEYEGTAREDDVFNELHMEDMFVDGLLIDVNPIKEEKSGDIRSYLSRCDSGWKERWASERGARGVF